MDVLYTNIKKLRKQAKMSQEDLAKRVGYTDRSSIAKIESGEVDLSQSKIKAFADVFNVTPQYLMGYDQPSENANPPEGMILVPQFKTAQEAIKFILEVPLVASFGGYDLDQMSDEELIDFANRVAAMIQIMNNS